MNRSVYKALRACASPFVNAYSLLAGAHALNIMEKTMKRQRKAGPIRVVFLAQYLQAWNKIDPVYQAMLDSPSFEPYIVCVPLNIKAHRLQGATSGGNEIYDYYCSHGYEAINSLDADGRWFDIQKLNPDYVFHSRPYNSFMPKQYTSGTIAKYAQVCSIMYGASWTDNFADVAYNDNYFRYVSLYFAEDAWSAGTFEKRFKKGVSRGLQKSVTVGMPVLENIVSLESRSTGAWDNLRDGVRVMWTPRWSTDEEIGGSHFLEYKDWFFSYAERHPEMSFVFRPHPLMFDNFIATGQMSREEVDTFKKRCKDLENTYLDEQMEYLDTLYSSDMLVMDNSSIVLEAFFFGKPIIYCPHEGANVIPDYEPMAGTFYEAYSSDEVGRCIEHAVCESADVANRRCAVIDAMSERMVWGATRRVLDALEQNVAVTQA